jgi:hypothetical protein
LQSWNLKELTEGHHQEWSLRLNLTQHGKTLGRNKWGRLTKKVVIWRGSLRQVWLAHLILNNNLSFTQLILTNFIMYGTSFQCKQILRNYDVGNK